MTRELDATRERELLRPVGRFLPGLADNNMLGRRPEHVAKGRSAEAFLGFSFN